jgi:DNA replication protein DnaC
MLELGRDGSAIEHACCECQDTFRVRVPLARGEPGFGRTVPCRCVSLSPRPQFDPGRMGIPRRLWGATLASWEPGNGRPRLAAQSFALGEWPPAQPMLALYGQPGRGKSHLAAAMMRAAWERHGVHGAFIEVPELMDRLRASFADDAMESSEGIMGWLERTPLLVLDDLGKDRQTEFVTGRIYRLINHRYGALAPTIITANPEEWDGLDAAVKSRLLDAAVSQAIECAGPDRRPQRGAA